jgi:hypothetical protein
MQGCLKGFIGKKPQFLRSRGPVRQSWKIEGTDAASGTRKGDIR